MTVIKIIAKVLLLPVVAVLTIIQWAGLFLNSISGMILRIVAFIFALTGIASLVFGIASGSDALKIIITGFVFFMIPAISDWIITMIDEVNTNIRAFIWDNCRIK